MKTGSSEKFEIIVLGGGTAGLSIALKAASSGYKTAMIEPNRLGGVCLNTGCIPTKAMLRAVEVLQEITGSAKFGINTENITVDFPKLMKRVRGIVKEGQDHIKLSVNNKNLKIFKEYGTFVGKRKFKVGGKIIEAKKIIISTGSRPNIPQIPGIENVKYFVAGSQSESENDILDIKKVPRTIIIIGGGYIGLEYATFFEGLGSKVYLLEAVDKVLPLIDDEIREVLLKRYAKKVNIRTNVKIKKLEENGGMKTVHYTDSKGNAKKIVGDALFVSAGRKPGTEGLDLEKSGIRVDKRGGIVINDEMETTCKGVYAVGDVTGKAMFAHSAKRGGNIAVMNALENKKLKLNFDLVPWVVFTHPPIAGIGLTKEKKGLGVMKANFSRAGRSRIIGDTLGMLKIWYEKKSGKIKRVEIIGTSADEMIHEFVALVNKDATVKELLNLIHVHPTLSEVVESLSEE